LAILTDKSTYTLLVFIIIGILFLIIIVLFIKYKRGFDIIKTTKIRLCETDDELENLRQRSLDREQLLRRNFKTKLTRKKTKYH